MSQVAQLVYAESEAGVPLLFALDTDGGIAVTGISSDPGDFQWVAVPPPA